jgi:pimeloyl-ACP methyl ester carboxylesterase
MSLCVTLVAAYPPYFPQEPTVYWFPT